MSDIYTIYKATNIHTGRSYIGFDSNWPNRKSSHKRNYKRKKTKFYSAILHYGWSSFSWEVLYQTTDKEHCLNHMEQSFIEKYNTIKEGYNMIEGGSGVLGAVKNTLWINNGNKQKRIKPDVEIPEGWSKGRLKTVRKVLMSQDSKDSIGRKNKGRLAGGKNPSAKKVLYNGEVFDCIKSAAIKYNTSVYFIKKNAHLI